MRPLDTATLDQAAKDYAAMFVGDKPPFDRAFVMTQFCNFTYKDEFDHLVTSIRKHLGPEPAKAFTSLVNALEPRREATFQVLLEEKRPVGYVPAEEA